MTLKDFSNLIEIQSLQNYIKGHLDQISSEKQRIDHLNSSRDHSKIELRDTQDKLVTLKETIHNKENELYELEKKIEKNQEHQLNIKNTAQLEAIENELKTFIPKKEELELVILESLEQLEELQKNEYDLSEFLKGSLKSLNELEIEVQTNISKEKKEIEGYQTRIQNLSSLLPNDVKEIFDLVNKKYEYKTPIVVINGSVCSKCNYPIDRNLASQIEKGTLLELCPGCERILAPISAQHQSF